MWSRDHILLETLTSLEFNDTFNGFGTIGLPDRDRRKDGQIDILRRHNIIIYAYHLRVKFIYYLFLKESLANAKVSVQQQCVCEDP